MRLTSHDLFGDSRPAGTDETNWQVCPCCGNEGWHFYVNSRSGLYHCHRCGAGGKIPDIGELMVVSHMLGSQPNEWPEIEAPITMPLSTAASRYLISRGVGEWWQGLFCLRETLGKRIFIPYYDNDGRLIYWNARDYTERATKRYIAAKDSHPLYVPYFQRTATTVVIVEGEFDAIRVVQLGYKAIALGGKKVKEYLWADLAMELRGMQSVRILLDGSALLEASQLQAMLPGSTIVALHPSEDPGGLSLDELQEVLD